MEREPPEDKSDDLLDLPLGPGAPGRRPSGPEAERRGGGGREREPRRRRPGDIGASATTPRHQRGRPPRAEGPRHRRGLWLLGLILLAGLAGALYWFLLRPPEAEASVPSLEFPPARVDGEGESASLSVVNRGRRVLVVDGLAAGGEAEEDFAVTAETCLGRPLGPGESCDVEVAFRPRRAGRRAAALVVSSNAPGPALEVPLAGTGQAPVLAVLPERLDFGRVAVGKASEATAVSFLNQGSAELTVARLAVEGSGERSFVWVANGCSGEELAPGEDCAVRLAFQPRETGVFDAELRAWSDAPEDPRVALAGVGVAPGIFMEPSAIDFGGLRPGQRSDSRTVRVSNTGNAPMTVERVELTGPAAGAFEILETDCEGRVLQGDVSCSARVVYRPREPAQHRAALRFRVPELSKRSEVALEGAALEPRLSLSESAVEFGRVVQFGTDERSVTVRNTGSADLVLESIDVEGGSGAFGLADRGCGERLAPGAECALGLRFSPSRVGRAEGRLTIAHNAPGAPTALPLVGLASQLPQPAIRLEPSTVAFGALPVDERSDILSVKVLSTGAAQLPLGDYEIVGQHAGDFRIVPASCAGLGSLLPGSDCTIGVRFRPQAAGRRNARLVVRHGAAGGRTEVALTGEGF